MMFTSKKRENLIKILSELTGNYRENTTKSREHDNTYHAESAQISIRSINITVEIPQLNSLIQEIRALRESIQEFVKLIKSRIEQSEQISDESSEQPQN